MAEIVSLVEIASIINDELNALTDELYNDSLISRNIKFNIQSNAMDNVDDKEYSDDVVTPGLVTRLSSPFAASQDFQSYQENILISLYAYYYDKDDLTYIFGEYSKRNSGKWFRVAKDTDNWSYSGAYELPTMNNRAMDQEERINLYQTVKYDFILNGYVKDDLDIFINGTQMPYLTYNSSIQKQKQSGDSALDTTKVTSYAIKTARSKRIDFIFVDNTEIHNIYEDIETGNFRNRVYTVRVAFYYNGQEYRHDNTADMILTNGSILTTETGLMRLTCDFEPYKGDL